MKTEQYERNSTMTQAGEFAGRANAYGYVRPGDYGYQINYAAPLVQGGRQLAEGIGHVAGVLERVQDEKRRVDDLVQEEKDRLFDFEFDQIKGAEFAALPVTLDEKSDTEHYELVKTKLTDKLRDDANVSDAYRLRKGRMLEAELQGLSIRQSSSRAEVIVKANITNAESMLKQSGDAGDIDGCRRAYAELTRLKVPGLPEERYYTARAAVNRERLDFEAMNPADQEKLYGKYREFLGGDAASYKIGDVDVPRAEMLKLIDKSRAVMLQRTADGTKEYGMRINAGTLSMDSLRAEHERGLLNNAMFESARRELEGKSVAAFERRIGDALLDQQLDGASAKDRMRDIRSEAQAMLDAGNLSREAFDKIIGAVKAKSVSALAEERTRQERGWQNAAGELDYMIAVAPWGDGEDGNGVVRDDLIRKIQKSNIPLGKRAGLIDKVEKRHESANNPRSLERSPGYQYAVNYVEQLKVDGKIFANNPRWYMWDGKVNDKVSVNRIEKFIRDDVTDFLRRNPNADQQAIRTRIDGAAMVFNKTAVSDLAERAFQMSQTARPTNATEGWKPRTGVFNGRKVIEEKPGEWKYAE